MGAKDGCETGNSTSEGCGLSDGWLAINSKCVPHTSMALASSAEQDWRERFSDTTEIPARYS